MENPYSPDTGKNKSNFAYKSGDEKNYQSELIPNVTGLPKNVGIPTVLSLTKETGGLNSIISGDFTPEADYLIRQLPIDFPERFINKIILFNEGQITRRDASVKIVEFIKKHINTPQMYQELFKCMYALQELDVEENIAYFMWSSLILDHEFDASYLNRFFTWTLSANKNDLKFLDDYLQDKRTLDSRRYISDVVIAICDTCLYMVKQQEEKGTVFVKKIFSMIFWLESKLNDLISRQKNDVSFVDQHVVKIYQGENRNFSMFNEMIKYLSMTSNGYYNARHSVTTQHDALRIYEILNSYKQELVKELLNQLGEKVKIDKIQLLKNRNANETEIAGAYELFKTNLFDFRDELRFNPHYIMIEYMRIFLYMFSMALGFSFGGIALIGLFDMTPTQGLIIITLMVSYTLIVHTRSFYRDMLPSDKYYQLQQSLPYLCANMERFSSLQLHNFLNRQLSDADNKNLFIYIPTFMHFLVTSYRQKLFLFINNDDLKDLLYKVNDKVTKMRWGNINR